MPDAIVGTPLQELITIVEIRTTVSCRDHATTLARRLIDERLAAYLVRAFDAHRSDELRLTHAEIATDLNSSREVISRLLKRMEQEGMVELGRHSIHRKNLGRAPR